MVANMTDNWRGTINNKHWYVLVNDNGFLVFRRCELVARCW